MVPNYKQDSGSRWLPLSHFEPYSPVESMTDGFAIEMLFLLKKTPLCFFGREGKEAGFLQFKGRKKRVIVFEDLERLRKQTNSKDLKRLMKKERRTNILVKTFN